MKGGSGRAIRARRKTRAAAAAGSQSAYGPVAQAQWYADGSSIGASAASPYPYEWVEARDAEKMDLRLSYMASAVQQALTETLHMLPDKRASQWCDSRLR